MTSSTLPSMRSDSPRLLTNSTPEEDELSHDLAALNCKLAELRNKWTAEARKELGALRAFGHVAGPCGTDMILFGDAMDDALSDLAWPARKWIGTRLEAL